MGRLGRPRHGADRLRGLRAGGEHRLDRRGAGQVVDPRPAPGATRRRCAPLRRPVRGLCRDFHGRARRHRPAPVRVPGVLRAGLFPVARDLRAGCLGQSADLQPRTAADRSLPRARDRQHDRASRGPLGRLPCRVLRQARYRAAGGDPTVHADPLGGAGGDPTGVGRLDPDLPRHLLRGAASRAGPPAGRDAGGRRGGLRRLSGDRGRRGRARPQGGSAHRDHSGRCSGRSC